MSLLTTPLFCVLHGKPIQAFPPDCPAATDDPAESLEDLHGEAYSYFLEVRPDSEPYHQKLRQWRACSRCSAIEVKHGS